MNLKFDSKTLTRKRLSKENPGCKSQGSILSITESRPAQKRDRKEPCSNLDKILERKVPKKEETLNFDPGLAACVKIDICVEDNEVEIVFWKVFFT